MGVQIRRLDKGDYMGTHFGKLGIKCLCHETVSAFAEKATFVKELIITHDLLNAEHSQGHSNQLRDFLIFEIILVDRFLCQDTEHVSQVQLCHSVHFICKQFICLDFVVCIRFFN